MTVTISESDDLRKQLGRERSIRRNEEAEIGRLRSAMREAYSEIIDAQGEWASVDAVFAPEWTHPLKRAAECLYTCLTTLMNNKAVMP